MLEKNILKRNPANVMKNIFNLARMKKYDNNIRLYIKIIKNNDKGICGTLTPDSGKVSVGLGPESMDRTSTESIFSGIGK